MSVEFSNAYQEILLENLMMVIKQNFVFQTQLKLTESNSDKLKELQNKLDEVNKLYSIAKEDSSKLQEYKTKAETNLGAHEEKSRIQSALNDELRKTKQLQESLSNKDSEIKSLQEKIVKLESLIPESKLKKLNKPSISTFVEEPKQEEETGSSF